MKKLKLKPLLGQIAAPVCIAAGSAGLIFGIAGSTFKIEYLNLGDLDARIKAATSTEYYSQRIYSEWNMNASGDIPAVDAFKQKEFSQEDWERIHGSDAKPYHQDIGDLGDLTGHEDINNEQKAARKKYSTLIIDGASHTQLDRSFNQGLYQGLVNFNNNKENVELVGEDQAQVLKPSQDNNKEFQNIYLTGSKISRVLGLAGFNHVSPLSSMFPRTSDNSRVDFSSSPTMRDTASLLIDGDIPNDQNVASVLFRSDQPAFLTGVATCKYFMNNLHLYHDKYQDLSVATYGGTPIPTVTIYMGGFQRGIEFFNIMILSEHYLTREANEWFNDIEGTDNFKNLLEHSKYKAEVEKSKTDKDENAFNELTDKMYEEFRIKMIKLGDFGTHFSGTFAAGDAIGITKQYLNRGASAIIAVAGPQTLDTAQEVKNQNSKCIVIGVDSASENSDYQKSQNNSSYEDTTKAPDGSASAQKNNIIKFSAVKDMTAISDKFLRMLAQGYNWDVDNDSPWKSTKPLPEIKPIPEEYLDFDENTGTIKGISGTPKLSEYNTLLIPNSIEKGGKTYTVKAVNEKAFDNKFTKDTNKNINVLQIDAANITLNNGAFNGCTAFTNLYLSNVKGEMGKITIPDKAIPFRGWNTDGEGLVKFEGLDNIDSKSLWEKIDKGFDSHTEGTLPKWVLHEAHPEKAICTTGYKTCGNIENGLISISWDGWYLFASAIQDVVFNSGGLTVSKPFKEVWPVKAKEYVESHSELPDDFKSDVVDFNKVLTFNKETSIYKNYSHVMAILGSILSGLYCTFPVGMTIMFKDNGEPYKPTGQVSMSILDWLKTNMYFTV